MGIRTFNNTDAVYVWFWIEDELLRRAEPPLRVEKAKFGMRRGHFVHFWFLHWHAFSCFQVNLRQVSCSHVLSNSCYLSNIPCTNVFLECVKLFWRGVQDARSTSLKAVLRMSKMQINLYQWNRFLHLSEGGAWTKRTKHQKPCHLPFERLKDTVLVPTQGNYMTWNPEVFFPQTVYCGASICPGHVPGACPPCVRCFHASKPCVACVRQVSPLCLLWPCLQTLSVMCPPYVFLVSPPNLGRHVSVRLCAFVSALTAPLSVSPMLHFVSAPCFFFVLSLSARCAPFIRSLSFFGRLALAGPLSTLCPFFGFCAFVCSVSVVVRLSRGLCGCAFARCSCGHTFSRQCSCLPKSFAVHLHPVFRFPPLYPFVLSSFFV